MFDNLIKLFNQFFEIVNIIKIIHKLNFIEYEFEQFLTRNMLDKSKKTYY